MNGSSNRVRLLVVDRIVDTGCDFLVGHGFAGEERVMFELDLWNIDSLSSTIFRLEPQYRIPAG